ncbi:MAG: DUF222 domain-containing protein [Propionicimonas sp.]|uniref:HNH endonuclease n=1 Tax=Propionicimonas sp. TaxID=1955623 RepID=UPI003D0E7895
MEQRSLETGDIVAWREALPTLSEDVPDAERIDRIRALEELKGAIAAAQAREAVALRRSVVEAEAARGIPARARGRGVAAEVALARRESPTRGDRLMGLARALVDELPHTMAALTRGAISEWRATLVCRETACLTLADRRKVDEGLAAELPSLSDRQVAATARRLGYELDPHSVVERSARAAEDRRVTIRPAPDTMAIVSAVLPVAQGVALYAALRKAADVARVQGDQRARNQVMADTLVCRVTGQTAADQVPVEIQLVMTDRSLWGGSRVAADISGYGPVPAEVARGLVAGLDPKAQAWVRRLYTAPGSGELVSLDSKRRTFPRSLRRFLATRDQACRTPWCGAPIRHADHVVPARQGGLTSVANGQGLCERCNQLKETPGWHAVASPDGEIRTTTATGHTYTSRAPTLPHPGPRIRIDILEWADAA